MCGLRSEIAYATRHCSVGSPSLATSKKPTVKCGANGAPLRKEQTMPEVRIKLPSDGPLPPYGELDFNYLEDISAPGAPDDWQPPPDLDESDRAKAWAIWRDKLAVEIADVLWHVFDRTERAWIGR